MFKARLVLLVLVFGLISACSGLPTSPNIERLGLTIAVGKVVESAEVPADKAIRVADVATAAKALLDGDEQALVSQISIRVRHYINFDSMTPQDRMLTELLISEIQHAIEVRIGTDRLSPEVKVRIMQVLDGVIEAAEFYLVAPS